MMTFKGFRIWNLYACNTDVYMTWHTITPFSSCCVAGKFWKCIFLPISVYWILVISSLMRLGSWKGLESDINPLHRCLHRNQCLAIATSSDCFLGPLGGRPAVSCPARTSVVFPHAAITTWLGPPRFLSCALLHPRSHSIVTALQQNRPVSHCAEPRPTLHILAVCPSGGVSS